jgi:hypothetical protein
MGSASQEPDLGASHQSAAARRHLAMIEQVADWIARMLINLAFDSVLGSIPFLGAVIDFFYRAHIRNLNLIKAREGRAARSSDWLVVCGAALVFLLALCLPIVLLIVTISLLW